MVTKALLITLRTCSLTARLPFTNSLLGECSLLPTGRRGTVEEPLSEEKGGFHSCANLRLVQEAFQALLESAPDAAVVIDSNGSVVMVNERALALFGYQRCELVGSPIEGLIPPGDRHENQRESFFARLHDRPMGTGLDLVALRKDGTELPVDISLSPMQSDGGLLVTAWVRDISERRRSEEELREQRELSLQLLEAQSDLGEGAAINDGERLIYANAALSRMYGYTIDELLRLPSILQIVAPEERAGLVERLTRRLSGETVEEFGETRVIRRDGRQIVIEYALKLITVNGKRLIISIVRDISERKRAEESIRQLSRRLLRVRDEEQERLARELGSGIASTLEAIRQKLTKVRDSGIVFDWKTLDSLRESIALTQDAARDVQGVSRLLYPPLLHEAGLGEAIRWYLYDYTQQTKVRVSLDIPVKFGRLAQDAERALFRVVQESLANVHRHSGSRSAAIALREMGSVVRLEIRDSGVGIPPGILNEATGTAAIAGVGIRGMVERMRELGGTLTIDSGSSGTTVVASLPVSPALPQPIALESES